MRSESGSVEEARDVFKHMKRLHIGCDDADMYISWASLETTEGKGKKAMEILQRAQERGARVQQAPIEAAIAKRRAQLAEMVEEESEDLHTEL